MDRGLEVQNLTLKVDERLILDGISLEVRPRQLCALVGANGSGKSSLLASIMGLSDYRVVAGDIKFKGQSLIGLSIDERSRLGLGLMFQKAPSFKGLSFAKVLQTISPGFIPEILSEDASRLLKRSLNQGFSGGELKRSELLQLSCQAPSLLLLDEPDSGVDERSLDKIERVIKHLLKDRAGLIISHNPLFLQRFSIDRTYVLEQGRLLNG